MHSTAMADALGAAAAVATSFLLVGLMRRWSEHWRHYDQPNDRSSHTRPTPYGGGVGIVLTVLGFCVAFAMTGRIAPSSDVAALLGSALLVAAISYVDDIRPLSATARFPIHILAATTVAVSVGYWSEIALPGGPVLPLGVLGLPLTCLWIVGVTNIYNFMDGIDGIAGSQAVIAGVAWMFVGTMKSMPPIPIIGGLIAAAAAGFLIHNWPPARIFMGDAGSAFLGFLLAALPLLSPSRETLFIPAMLILWPFLFDGTLTILRRLGRRENIFAAHRSHLYQRLNIAGRSHASITAIYALLAALGAVAAVTENTVAMALIPFAALTLWTLVARAERVHFANNPSASSSRRTPSRNDSGA